MFYSFNMRLLGSAPEARTLTTGLKDQRPPFEECALKNGAAGASRTRAARLQGEVVAVASAAENGAVPRYRTEPSASSARRFHLVSLDCVEPTAGIEPAPPDYGSGMLPATPSRLEWYAARDSNPDLTPIERRSCRWTSRAWRWSLARDSNSDRHG